MAALCEVSRRPKQHCLLAELHRFGKPTVTSSMKSHAQPRCLSVDPKSC